MAVREGGGLTNKSQYFQSVRDMILAEDKGTDAVEAIKERIRVLLDYNLCTLDEFLCLIDLDFRNEWTFIAEEIARKAETAIRSGALHPNDIKPWHNCHDYKNRLFDQVAEQREWRKLHSAINNIIGRVSARFHC